VADGAGGSNAPGYKLDIPGALTRGNTRPLVCCAAERKRTCEAAGSENDGVSSLWCVAEIRVHARSRKVSGPMKDFAGRIAVVTGGGTGMGRELVRQLVAEGCNVAMCDVSTEAMAETKRLCEVEKLPQGLRITTHIADVAIEGQLQRFRDELAEQQSTDKIHLLFNNAGIGGGGSLFTNTREQWERTFNICWGGVYLGVRTFMPMLLRADQGHIVNTSSVNGFWAMIGLGVSHTAYSAAKFAVKGFTEALITDLRLNAPHIKCSVVMPGHIGTSIVSNSRKIQSGSESDRLSEAEIVAARQRLDGRGIDTEAMSDEDIQNMALDRARTFRDEAPMTAAAAAKVILDGVKAERWRILVGDDAHKLDERVRQTPERAYDADFFESFTGEVIWRVG
jgi:NAD(P)-dependent dehydrogenase (short-subunit alcohol dehydrogenase family)